MTIWCDAGAPAEGSSRSAARTVPEHRKATMDDCENCGRALCRDCDTHYCTQQCPCGRSHTCDCACGEYLDGLASAVDAPAAVISPSEQEAAAAFARECTNTPEVIRWCADRVRSVDGSPAVQGAADLLHDLSTRLVLDTTAVRNRPAVIRWCAQEIHSMGGDADVERAAEYLDGLATESEETTEEQQEAKASGCRCGHPQARHWTDLSGRMTFPNGCHDCPGWDGAHAYGQELPWLPEGV